MNKTRWMVFAGPVVAFLGAIYWLGRFTDGVHERRVTALAAQESVALTGAPVPTKTKAGGRAGGFVYSDKSLLIRATVTNTVERSSKDYGAFALLLPAKNWPNNSF